jgi:hypothetical protein
MRTKMELKMGNFERHYSAYTLNRHLGHLGRVTLYTEPLQLHPIQGGSHIFLNLQLLLHLPFSLW